MNDLSLTERGNGGFTLVELLIVVIIIGILASIGVPQYARTIERARGAEADAGIQMIQSSEKIYYAENGTYYNAGDWDGADETTLDITLPQQSWTFNVDASAGQSYTITATRKNTGPCPNKTRTMTSAGVRAGDWAVCAGTTN